MFATATASRTRWHPLSLLILLAAWLAVAGNLPLWSAMWQLPEHQGWHGVRAVGTWVLLVWGATTTVLALVAWRGWARPLGLALMFVSAASSYFMASYGIVVDPSMMANVAHTDLHETLDLMSWPLGVSVLVGCLLPGWWWWTRPRRPVPMLRLASQHLGLAVGALGLTALVLWLGFQDAATLMRNHKQLRYMVNPLNTVYAATRLALDEGLTSAAQAHAPLTRIATDAHLAAPPTSTGDPDHAPLIVMVVGETARAANFGLQGYARDTTPQLKHLQAQGPGQLVYFNDVTSCGTNTHTSLPCLFSLQGRDGVGQESRHENLLDVLQRAGLAVAWVDNQSGCKGVCDRVPTTDARSFKDPAHCSDDDCLDSVLPPHLPGVLSALNPERRAKGTILVLHQMGSHGPAYHHRSAPALKAFLPECTEPALPQCAPETIVNAYDNSLRQTDQLLSQTIAWLAAQDRPTALLYVSDHGESLGENGLYLHGMPYRMAPSTQTHVPMLVWVSPRMAQLRDWTTSCLSARAREPLSHDHVFGTVLKLAGVRTQAVPKGRDALARCR